jgi:hypothetical protein
VLGQVELSLSWLGHTKEGGSNVCMFCSPVALHGKVVGLLQGQVALEVADSVQPSNTRAEKIKKLVQWHGLLHEWRLLQTAAQTQQKFKRGGVVSTVNISQRGVNQVGRKRVSVAVNLKAADGKHSAQKKVERVKGGGADLDSLVASAAFDGGHILSGKSDSKLRGKHTINVQKSGLGLGDTEAKDETAVSAHKALMTEFFNSTNDISKSAVNSDSVKGALQEDEDVMALDCEVCSKSGREVDLIPALGRGWCTDHFKCEHCARPLDPDEDFYGWKGKPFCRRDFAALFGPSVCAGCMQQVLYALCSLYSLY